jgi:hypothetical protein
VSVYIPIRDNQATGPNNYPSSAALSPSDKRALVSFFELLIETDQKQRRKCRRNYELEQE